jgi:hypothetical protein
MNRLVSLVSLVSLAILAMLSACSSASAPGPASAAAPAEGAWPARPANGAPIAFEYVEPATNAHGEPAARFRVYDFDERAVKMYGATVHYLAADGHELSSFPASRMKQSGIVAGKSRGEEIAGIALPAGTTRVTVDVDRVEFADGKQWEADVAAR